MSENKYIDKLLGPDKYFLKNLCKQTSAEDDEFYKNKYEKLSAEIEKLKIEDDSEFQLNVDSQEFLDYKRKYIEKVKAEISQQIKQCKIRDNSEAFIILGLPGAGKSTLINEIKMQKGAYHLDFDSIRMNLVNEFHINNLDNMNVIRGTQNVLNGVLKYLQSKKVNYIQEKLGNDYNSIQKLVQNLKTNDYDINLELLQVSNGTSRKRNLERCEKFIENGLYPRLVNDKRIQNFSQMPLNTYIRLINENAKILKNYHCQVTETGNNKPFYLLEISAENGKNLADSKYIDMCKDIKKFAKNQISISVLKLIENEDKDLYEFLVEGDNYSNQDDELLLRNQYKQDLIRKMIEKETEKLMLETFEIKGNECIDSSVKCNKLNFDINELKKRVSKIIEEKHNESKLLEEINKVNIALENELKANKENEQKTTTLIEPQRGE